MTYDSRLTSPIYNLDSQKLFAISSFDGTSNIMISSKVDVNDEKLLFTPLTNLDNGMHLFSLAWINNELYVDGVFHQGRKIYRVMMNTGELLPIMDTNWDSRDPDKMLDGMIYVKDQSGVMNLVFARSNGITNIYPIVTTKPIDSRRRIFEGKPLFKSFIQIYSERFTFVSGSSL